MFRGCPMDTGREYDNSTRRPQSVGRRSLVRDCTGLPEQAKHVHAPPRFDDLVVLESLDRDALQSHLLSLMCHRGSPARGNLAALRHLIFNCHLQIRVNATVPFYGLLQTDEPFRSVRIVRVVMHDIGSDVFIEPIEVTSAPELE